MVIEDYDLLRDSIVDIINSDPDFTVIASFPDMELALPRLNVLRPEIILTDISLPGMNGVEGIKRIKQFSANVSIIVFSVHERNDIVFEALCNGAVGYITKSAGKQKILDALHQLNSGGAPMSANIARMVVESLHIKKYNDLTPRENDVIQLLSKGKTYSMIADELFLSVNTIKTHVKSIYDKLQIKSKEELLAYNKDQVNDK